MPPLNILIIDDESVICRGCSLVLAGQGHQVECCSTCREGIEAIRRNRYDLVLLDLKLPDRDGSELLRSMGASGPTVIVMSGYATVRAAIGSMKLGAVDFLPKPFTDDELLRAVGNAMPGKP